MYCPNCGKDCGNSNFCPNCGKKLSVQPAAPSAWAPGMACPHCGGTKLDGKNCAFCGAVLVVDPPAISTSNVFDHELDSYDIPYRSFYPNPFENHSFTISEEGLVIQSGSLFSKRREVIPYHNLIKAEYRLFSDSKHEIVFHYVDTDRSITTTELFHGERHKYGSDMLYHAFWVIKHLSPASAVFSIDYPPVESSTGMIIQQQNIDITTYFDRFNPFRVQAANELCHDARITQQQAQELIDDLFFSRQATLYHTDSLVAVRDFNRIFEEINKEIEEKNQERRENRRKRRRR